MISIKLHISALIAAVQAYKNTIHPAEHFTDKYERAWADLRKRQAR